MQRHFNQGTQPSKQTRVFNDWEVVTKGWYFACPSRKLPKGGTQAVQIADQRVVLFRGQDGKVRALDGYCPHMGTDLAIGTVVGDQIRCFFHQWQFDGAGRCARIPCQDKIPDRARTQAYATEERYGFIWIYPEAEAPCGVVELDELRGQELIAVHGKPFLRSCHHHVSMINGIDPQHLRTVHDLHFDMELSLEEDERRRIIDFALRGEMPQVTAKERFARRLLGESYEYRMRYADATIGALTLMKNVFLFGGKRRLPELHMLFAYRPLERGQTLVQPIYLARKRPGLWGSLVSWGLIGMVQLAFKALQGEDGKVYENMRFNPNILLPIDEPVARYISYVERLEPSRWSRSGSSTGEFEGDPIQSPKQNPIPDLKSLPVAPAKEPEGQSCEQPAAS